MPLAMCRRVSTGPEEDGYGGTAMREAAVRWASRGAAGLLRAGHRVPGRVLPGRCDPARRRGQPWTACLAVVAYVALAAKVKETACLAVVAYVALAAKVKETRTTGNGGEADPYVFEAKTVRWMELLVLSALGWRMYPVTPFSYLELLLADAAARRRHCELIGVARWRLGYRTCDDRNIFFNGW
jgi:cyclin D3, plant